MKKIIVCMALLIIFSKWSTAQCDKRITWYASRMERLDEKGNVMGTKEGSISIVITKDKFSFKVAEKPDVSLTGDIKETTCEWKEPFKNGQTKIIAELTDGRGSTQKDMVTIEGVDGKLNLFIYREGKTFRIPIDKYETAE